MWNPESLRQWQKWNKYQIWLESPVGKACLLISTTLESFPLETKGFTYYPDYNYLLEKIFVGVENE